MKRRFTCADMLSGLFSLFIVLFGPAAFGGTLDDVKERGRLNCGIEPGLAGFGVPNNDGVWIGFDVDFCRAVAAAIFGDATAVNFRPLTSAQRFTALQSGEIDVLSRTTTWTFSRDVNLGFEFIGVWFYDGQAFLVNNDLGVSSVLELDGARICVETGTTTELNLADYFRTNGMAFESVVVNSVDEARENYLANACDAHTTDASGLAAVRSTFPDSQAHQILPEVISKEPLSPLVRHGDNQWGDVVRWVRNAVILAEEFLVTAANVTELRERTRNPEIRRLLGAEGQFGFQLGLSNDWAFNVIRLVGNYGEIFDRNLGPKTPLGLERGLNALWNDGGILYAPPLR